MTTSIRRAGAMLLTGALLACGAQSRSHAQGAPAPAAAQANTQSPSEVVQNSAQSMLRELDANRDMYRKDPSKIGQLVDKYLLPHFDVEFAARLVLGKYWRTATPEQRKRFIDAFYHSLLNNYGSALSDFTADKLKIFPANVDPNADRATVRTEVKRSNGDRISVNYYMHKTPEGWKAWDVVIDGISYVNSYREDFGAQIDKQGIDAVINRLEKGEKPSDIGKTTAGKKTS
ncbi:MAG: hypothetical protein JWN85_985 [Gammaproteobacteria bacterium]|nr:hypothetical protein [Gammaproteobacteria bacterium]